MVLSTRIFAIFVILIGAIAPASVVAGPDVHAMLARMLVGNAGARTTVSLRPKTRTFEARTFGFDGGIIRKDVFRADADGELIAWQVFDGKGMARYRVICTFDRMGRNSGWGIYNKDGKMIRTMERPR